MTSQYDINLSNGSVLSTLYPLEVNGPDNRSTPRQIQRVRPTSQIVVVTPGTNTFSVPGDETSTFRSGFQFQVADSTSNDGTYNVTTSTFSGGNTQITTVENWTGTVPDGVIIAHVVVLVGDISARFVSGFILDIQQSSQVDGTYTVQSIGSAFDGTHTIVPVANGSIRDNINTPVGLPYGEIEYAVLDANTSLKLPGRGVINYGEKLVENIVRMTEHFAADTAPELNTALGTAPAGNPLTGQLWYKTLAGQEGFKFFDGSVWTSNVDVDDGSLLFRDPQNTLVPNTDIHITGDESQLPAGYLGTVEAGMVVWTENNPNPLDPIFRVVSEDGSERLRVEHDGWIRTTNNLDVIGGANGSTESYFRGTLGISADGGLPNIANTLTVEGNGITVNSGTGLMAELELNAPSGQSSMVNYDIAGVRYGNVGVDSTVAGNPLEINSNVATDVVIAQGGGNVGIRTVGNPTATLQIQNHIFFNEGGGDANIGPDIRAAFDMLVGADSAVHVNYDMANAGTHSFEVRSGSDNNITSTVRMHLDDNKFFVDTDTLYVNTAADRVGVNMIPSYAFDVSGTARFNNPVGINNVPPSGSPVWLEVTGDVQINSQIRGSNQSAASPTYSFTNDLDTGMWHTGTALSFAVGGVEHLNIGSTVLSTTNNIEGVRYTFTGDTATYLGTAAAGLMELRAATSITLYSGGTSSLSISNTGLMSSTTPNYETLILSDNDLINKKFLDTVSDTKVALNGDIMTGILTLSGDPSNPLEAVTKQYVDGNFMPFDTNIPTSRVGELNFLPIDIDGDFTGASVPYTIGGTFMLRERDGSLIGIRPGGNGDINRYFFMHALDGDFANVVSTDAEYRPPFLAANEVVASVVNAHSFSEGFQAVIRNNDTWATKLYWIHVNGTMDPSVHTFVDLTPHFVPSINFAVERVYDKDLWITMEFGTGDLDVTIYDNNFVQLNTTLMIGVNSEISALPITGGFAAGGNGTTNTTIANIEHYVVGDTIRIAQHFGLYIPYVSAATSRIPSFNALMDYDIVSNTFTRPLPGPYVYDPNIAPSAQTYPFGNIHAYGRHDGSQRLTTENYSSTTFQTSVSHIQGEIAPGATWQDHINNFGRPLLAPYSTRLETTVYPADAAILGKTLLSAMFVGETTILTTSASRFPSETVPTTKRARNFLADTTSTRIIKASTIALEPPLSSVQEFDPVLLNNKVLSTIIRSSGAYETRFFDTTSNTYSTFNGDNTTITLTPELTIPTNYLTQITALLNTLDANTVTFPTVFSVLYLDSNIFAISYGYFDGGNLQGTHNIATVTLAGSVFSIADSVLAISVTPGISVSNFRSGHGVFVDGVNNAIYAIVPSMQQHTIGGNSSQTYLIKVSTTVPGQLLANSTNVITAATWNVGNTGIHPNFGPHAIDVFANNSTHGSLKYVTDATANVVDRMRTIFDGWITTSLSPTALAVITIQAPLGFNIFVSEFPVFINGSQYTVPLQSIDLASTFPAPQNSLFYTYVELLTGVPQMVFSLIPLADSNTLVSVGTITTGTDGILLVDVKKTSTINNVDVDNYLNVTQDSTMIGDLILDHDPLLPLEAATMQYVDAQLVSSQSYYIEVTAAGVGTVLPPGWSVVRNSAGNYTVTHNLNNDHMGFALQAKSLNWTFSVAYVTIGVNSFNILTGVSVDQDFKGTITVV